jgi:CRP/FNR family cyclic AMP-dependent transcriptional regulator
MRSDELIMAPHPFLEGMCEEHRRSLSEAAMRASFAEGECIFREGEPAKRFYLIEEGSVFITSRVPGHSQIVIQTIGAGDALGWSWLFEPYTWHFGARADEPTRALVFYAARLREQCEEDPKLGYELMKRVSRVVIHRLQATRLKAECVRGPRYRDVADGKPQPKTPCAHSNKQSPTTRSGRGSILTISPR